MEVLFPGSSEVRNRFAVEFVEFRPGSLHSRNFGKFLPDTRISQRIIHVGIVVKDRAAADRFYKDMLGFKLQWQGGMKDEDIDWVAMRVPDGTDWLEYMLNVHNPDPRQLGVMHHLSLGVPSIQAGYELAAQRGYQASEKPQIGRDGKWQYNLYDPNYTRVELMEPTPVQKPCCSPILIYFFVANCCAGSVASTILAWNSVPATRVAIAISSLWPTKTFTCLA